jgi:hypothetical protein
MIRRLAFQGNFNSVSLRIQIFHQPRSLTTSTTETLQSSSLSEAVSPKNESAGMELTSGQKSLAKGYMNLLHEKKLIENSRVMISALTGTHIDFKLHQTPSPLSSASLLASFLRHLIIRNNEIPSRPFIKSVLDFAKEKSEWWNTSENQTAKERQYLHQISKLRKKVELLKLKLKFDGRVQEEISKCEQDLQKLTLLLDVMDKSPRIRLNVHPSNQESPRRVKGIKIRMSGPNKGSRSATWNEVAGSTSISSDLVVYEEAKVQLPSKLGAYGLQVIIVYSESKDLVSQSLSLNAPYSARKICPFNRNASNKKPFY